MPNPKYFKWLEQIASTRGWDVQDMLNDDTYNYEHFYNKQPELAIGLLNDSPTAHFTDIAKTVKHPTFSEESDYSGKKSKYNPKGIKGGKWSTVNGKGRYTFSDSQLKHGWDIRKTIDYMNYAEDNGVELRLPNGNKAYIDGAYFDRVLPTIEVFPSKTKK